MHRLVQWRGKYTRNLLRSRASSQFYFNIHILFLFYLAIHFRLYRVRPPSSYYTIIRLDLYYISYIHTGHFLYILFHLSLSSTVFLPFLVVSFLLHFFMHIATLDCLWNNHVHIMLKLFEPISHRLIHSWCYPTAILLIIIMF